MGEKPNILKMYGQIPWYIMSLYEKVLRSGSRARGASAQRAWVPEGRH